MKDGSKGACTSDGDSGKVCLCPLGGLMEVFSKKWALLIIGVIGNEKKLRYNRIMERLGGISPKSLSDCLKMLVDEGLLTREVYAEIPPRVEYSLTKDGEELREVMMPLMAWVAERNRPQ